MVDAEGAVSHLQSDDLLSAQDVQTLLSTVGVALPRDEGAGLAVQAVPYFAMLDRLMTISPGSTEPSVTFAIDRWASTDDE